MGYSVHITRRNNWFDDGPGEIRREEWQRIVSSDDDLHLYEPGEEDNVDPCYKLDIPGFDHAFFYDEATATIEVRRGYYDDILGKVLEIAAKLGAVVQGDECEYYRITACGKETTFERPDPGVHPNLDGPTR